MKNNTDTIVAPEIGEKPLDQMLSEKITYLSQWVDNTRQELPKKERELFEARRMLERFNRTTPNEKKRSGINWKEQVLSCVNIAQHIVKTTDILVCVFGYNIPKAKKRSHIVMISITLNKLVKEGKVKEYKVKGTKGYYYGLPNWFNGNEPKKQFDKEIE